MNTLKALFCLFCIGISALCIQAAPAPTVKEQRAKAEKIVKSINERLNKSTSYTEIEKNRNTAELREAFDIYTSLIKNMDDADSGSDLVTLVSIAKSLTSTNFEWKKGESPYEKLACIRESYALHEKNNRYLVNLWLTAMEEEFFFRQFIWFPNSLNLDAEKYSEDSTRLHNWALFNLGEKILKQSPGNLSSEDHSYFLLNFARLFCLPLNSENLPSYGFFHKLTPFTAPRALGKGIFQDVRDKKDFLLLDKSGLPITYSIPTSWESAANDGQRVTFLLSEAVRINPSCDIHARMLHLSTYYTAFTPQFAFKQHINNYNSHLSDEQETMWNNNSLHFTKLLESLENNQTIVFLDDKFQVLTLPANFHYLRELKALSEGEPLDTSLSKEKYTASQKATEQARLNASKILFSELTFRLNYSEAIALTKANLQNYINTPLASKFTETLQYLTTPQVTFIPGEEGNLYRNPDDIKLPVLYRNATSIELNFHKINVSYLFNRSKELATTSKNIQEIIRESTLNHSNSLLQKCLSLHTDPEAGKDILSPSRSVQFKLTAQPEHKETLDLLKIPHLDAGSYLIEARIEGVQKPEYHFITVAPVNVNTTESREGVTLLVSDARSNIPKNNAEISVIEFSPNEKSTPETEDIEEEGMIPSDNGNIPSQTPKEYLLKTDDSGKALIPSSPDNSSRYFLFYVRSGEDICYTSFEIDTNKRPSHGKKTTAQITTDRHVYRPGQTVYWTAWLGETDVETGAKFLKNFPVTVEIPNIKEKENLVSSERGIIEGSFVIPENAKLTDYSLIIKKDVEDKDSEDNYTLGQSNFLVEEYKKENLILSLSSDKRAYKFGDTARITVNMGYYSGEPVSSGIFNINSRESSDFSFKKENITIEKGQAVFEIPLPKSSSSPSPIGNNVRFLTFEVTGKDDSLRQVSENITFSVSDFQPELNVLLDSGYGRSGENISGKITLKTSNEEAISSPGEAVLYLISQAAEQSAPEKKKVLSWNIATNKNGETQLRFLPPNAGYYELEVTFPSDAAKSKFVTQNINFHVVPKEGENIIPFALYEEDDYKLIPYKSDYKIGETAKILVITPPHIKSITLFRSLGFSDEETRTINTPSPLTETEWVVNPENAPVFKVSILANTKKNINPYAPSYLLPSVNITVLRDSSNLKLNSSLNGEELTPQHIPSLEPAQKSPLLISIKHQDGNPVINSPVIITVYDKSLDRFILSRFVGNGSEIFPYWQPFWSDRRDHFYSSYSFSSNNISYPGYYDHSFYSHDSHSKEFLSYYFAYAFIKKTEKVSTWDKEAVLLPWEGSAAPPVPSSSRELIFRKITSHSYIYFSYIDSIYSIPLPSSKKQVEVTSSENQYSLFRDRSRSMMLMEKNAAWGGLPVSMANKDAVSVGMSIPSTAAGSLNKLTRGQPIHVRREFLDLLKWSGTVFTNEQGQVTLPLTMPDNLTTWKVVAGAADEKLNIGTLHAEFQTTKKLVAELHTPRLLVEKDVSRLTSVVRNNTDEQTTVDVSLSIEGEELVLLPNVFPEKQTVIIPPRASATIQWQVLADKEGESTLTLTAKGDTSEDISEYKLPLNIRGAYKGESVSKILTPGSAKLTASLSAPSEINPDLSQLHVTVSPGLIPVVTKALTYLTQYPYNCIEQTMNRFTPAWDAANTLGQGFIKKDTLDSLTSIGLEKLATSQNLNGGWGWFEGMESSRHITAQVVHGLLKLPKDSPHYKEAEPLLSKATAYLKESQEARIKTILSTKEKNNPNAVDVYIHLVLQETGDKDLQNKEMTDILVKQRHRFSPYSLTQLGLILHNNGEKTILKDILKNLSSLRKSDKESGTYWLSLAPKRYWWYWEHDDIETQAAYLQLLTATDPKGTATRGLARWIATNREHSYYWKSTRDTSLALEALCDYIKQSGEGTEEISFDLLVNGNVVKTLTYFPDKALEFNGDISIPTQEIIDGENTLELRPSQPSKTTPLYFSAAIKYFSLESKLTASGSDLTVSRSIQRITDSNKLLPVNEGDSLISGDIIEVTLTFNAKHDYQNIMVHDPKPAGCEPYSLNSGYQFTPRSGDKTLSSYYSELADKETRFFLDILPAGEHSLTYKLRVERPGTYTALPAEAEVMYTPIIRGNSNEFIMEIQPPDVSRKEPEVKENTKETVGKGDESTQEAFEMAFRARIGWGQEINHPVALRWLKKAAADHIPALVSLARWSYQQKEDPDHEIEAKAYAKQALSLAPQHLLSQDGDVLSAIGKLYTMDDDIWEKEFAADFPNIPDRRQHGIGLLKRAGLLYEKAAQEGSGYAAYRLGLLYMGDGIFLSPRRALEYFEMGAKLGFAPALYHDAKLMPDNQQSEAYLRQAIEAKYFPASELLSERLFARRDEKGDPIASEQEEALALLEQAAQAGCPLSQLTLAALYENGKLVPQDDEKAQFWHSLATDGHYFKEDFSNTPNLPILDAIYGRHLPDKDILPLSDSFAKTPLPETLPFHSGRVDGLTDGELIKQWESGELNVLPELARRFLVMDDPVSEVEESLKEYLPETVIRYNSLARQGDTQAALDLAKILIESDFPQDKTLGYQWLTLLAKEKHAQALRLLATHDYLGMDTEKGVDELVKLAERNDLPSIIDLQDTFSSTGRGGEINLARAKAYKAQFDDIHNLTKLLACVERDKKNDQVSKDDLITITQHIVSSAELEKNTQLQKESSKVLSDLQKKK